VPYIEEALATNPNDPDALSLMAAVYYCVHQPEKAQPFIQRVEKINPRCAEIYDSIGHWLSTGRQFAEAELAAKRAQETLDERQVAIWKAKGISEADLAANGMVLQYRTMYTMEAKWDPAGNVLRK
jgi:Tfp pilus assembly protein PilF